MEVWLLWLQPWNALTLLNSSTGTNEYLSVPAPCTARWVSVGFLWPYVTGSDLVLVSCVRWCPLHALSMASIPQLQLFHGTHACTDPSLSSLSSPAIGVLPTRTSQAATVGPEWHAYIAANLHFYTTLLACFVKYVWTSTVSLEYAHFVF